MTTRTTRSAVERIAFPAIFALGLITLTACEIDPVAPRAPSLAEYDPPEVRTSISASYASAGELVRLEIVVEGRAEDAGLRATVTWDPRLFEYSHALPAEADGSVTGNPDGGWIEIDARGSSRVGGWVTVHFRALVDAETSGILAQSTLYSDTEEDGEIIRAAG